MRILLLVTCRLTPPRFKEAPNATSKKCCDIFCISPTRPWREQNPPSEVFHSAFDLGVHSPLRIHRRDVDARRRSKGQGRGPGHDLLVRRPRPLALAPRQRRQLQVAGETPATAAQVDAQRAGRRRERLAEAAVGRIPVVLVAEEDEEEEKEDEMLVVRPVHRTLCIVIWGKFSSARCQGNVNKM